MRPVAIDEVVWSVGLCVSLSVTAVSHTKTVELIEMLFGIWTRVGPKNRALDGVHIPISEGAILRVKIGPPKTCGHVWWSVYSKRLSRGQHWYIADPDLGVLDATW